MKQKPQDNRKGKQHLTFHFEWLTVEELFLLINDHILNTHITHKIAAKIQFCWDITTHTWLKLPNILLFSKLNNKVLKVAWLYWWNVQWKNFSTFSPAIILGLAFICSSQPCSEAVFGTQYFCLTSFYLK